MGKCPSFHPDPPVWHIGQGARGPMTPSSWLRAVALLCWLPQGILEPSSPHQVPLSPGRDRTVTQHLAGLGLLSLPPTPRLSAALVLYHTRRLEKSPCDSYQPLAAPHLPRPPHSLTAGHDKGWELHRARSAASQPALLFLPLHYTAEAPSQRAGSGAEP